MRVPALLLLSGLMLGLAACNTTDTAGGPVAGPLASAPQPVEGYDWFYHVDGDDARLAYGLAESDDLRLCSPQEIVNLKAWIDAGALNN